MPSLLTPDLVNKCLHFLLGNHSVAILIEVFEQLSKLILGEPLSLAYLYQVCLDECACLSPAERAAVVLIELFPDVIYDLLSIGERLGSLLLFFNFLNSRFGSPNLLNVEFHLIWSDLSVGVLIEFSENFIELLLREDICLAQLQKVLLDKNACL